MNTKFYPLLGTIALLIAIIAYLTLTMSNMQNVGKSEEKDMAQETDYLKLSSLTLWTDHNQLIGKLEPNMELKKDQPIFLRANFSNPNETTGQYIAIVQVSDSESQIVAQSQLWGRVIGSENVMLNTFWQPSNTGTYEAVVYVFKPSDLPRTDTPVRLPPLASVPVRVVD